MTRVITQLIRAFGVAAAYSRIMPPNKCVCMVDGTHTQDCTIRKQLHSFIHTVLHDMHVMYIALYILIRVPDTNTCLQTYGRK